MASVHACVVTAGAALIWLTSGLDRWRLGPVLVLTAFTLVSVLRDISDGTSKIRVSGVPIGLTMAVVLLGPGPAALLGAATMLVSWTRSRVASPLMRNNVATFMWYPLGAGLFFHETVALFGLTPAMVAYYLVVFATFVVALTLNFLGVFGFRSYLYGSSIVHWARQAVIPIMSAELFSGLLTMAVVWAAIQAGTVGIILAVLVLMIFQYLIGELLKSKARGEQLHRVATTDELTGLSNRERFRARLDKRIEEARETDETFAVMLLDLDRFKEVN
ncbi:MAG: GGDEF domain-containing protein, partial [Solirubrobacterales bacterium]|nr:GGDEF domain-containing protein [Solirubrobacterales bacterium]